MTILLKVSGLREQWWNNYPLDEPNSNEAVRNLVMDQTISAIFHRNCLSCMI